MRRDKISIRYRQVSILRRWSITTLSRHQLLHDELCFIFCYRLTERTLPNDAGDCTAANPERERERAKRGRHHIVLLGERICVDVTHELREHEHGDNSVSRLFCFYFLCSPTLTIEWVSGVYFTYPPCPLSCCDAHVYTALHIHTYAHACARTMLPTQANRFHSLPQFGRLFKHLSKEIANLKWI